MSNAKANITGLEVRESHCCERRCLPMLLTNARQTPAPQLRYSSTTMHRSHPRYWPKLNVRLGESSARLACGQSG
jgi:hypothetical protein